MYRIGAAGFIKRTSSCGDGMNVCWCTLSGGECSGGGVSSFVCAATHDVYRGHAELMASLARRAGGAGMANLDLVAVSPAVSNFVPSWFGVTPVGGVNTCFCQWGRRSWCVRGWDSNGAGSCDGEPDVGDGFGEHCVSGHQVLDGGVLLNCHICQIVKGRSHLLRLFKFGGLVCAKCCVRILAKGADQRVFQLGYVWSGSGQRFHLCQANVMLPHARACLVPVVIMVLSEMETLASTAKTWHFSCFLV